MTSHAHTLFLDMAPISSLDVTRSMPGQPKRLSRNYLRRNGGNWGKKSFYVLVFKRLFRYSQIFSALSSVCLFAWVSFVFVCLFVCLFLFPSGNFCKFGRLGI